MTRTPANFERGVLFWVLAGWMLLVMAPVANGQSMNQLFADAVESSLPRVVKVFGAGAGRVDSYASGVVVSPDGLIATMHGVFLAGDRVRVALADGRTFPASVMRRNRQYELALLKIDSPTPDYFELSTESVGEKGDWVMAIHNAFMVAEREEPMSVNLGVISLATSIQSYSRMGDAAYSGELVLIDAITSNPGAGGGAVITQSGELVGMIGKIISSTETNTRINYAVPGHILAKFIAGDLPEESTMDQASGDEPSLGIELFSIGGVNSPAYIDRVVRGGPADQIGLRPDDLVISLAGEKTATIRDFQTIVSRLRVGEETVIVVRRSDELIRASIIPVAKE